MPNWFKTNIWNVGAHDFDRRTGKLQTVVNDIIWHTKRAYCNQFGHKIIDCSSAGPESGNMDHACERCGEYWHIPLY